MERLGEVDTIGFECAEVGVNGRNGDLELAGDLFEGVSVLSKFVFALHASASMR